MKSEKACILIGPKTHERICNWVDLAHGEVSWVGEVLMGRVGDQAVAFVDDVVFLKQWGTAAGTYIDPVQLTKWMEEKGFVDPVTTPMSFYWGHSHARMSVYWSPTDEKCIESFLNFTGIGGVVASVVYNKAGEWKGRMDVNVGKGEDRVQWTQEADMEVDAEVFGTRDECVKEIKELLTWGEAPTRDLSDPRIKELDDREKEEKGRLVGGRRGAGTVLYAGTDGKSMVFSTCKKCEKRERCAIPVISTRRAESGGCMAFMSYLPVENLTEAHWRDAQVQQTVKELQSWRDRERNRNEQQGVVGRCKVMCMTKGCAEVISSEEKGYFEYGKCVTCCHLEGTDFVDGKRVTGKVVEEETREYGWEAWPYAFDGGSE